MGKWDFSLRGAGGGTGAESSFSTRAGLLGRRLLDPVWRRIRDGRTPPTEPDAAEAPVQALVARHDRLTEAEREDFARALCSLWDAFIKQFDGPAGFLAAKESARAAYLSQLGAAEVRFSAHQDSPKGHYHLAVACMLHYAGAFVSVPSPETVALSARVAAAVDRGRLAGHAPFSEPPDEVPTRARAELASAIIRGR